MSVDTAAGQATPPAPTPGDQGPPPGEATVAILRAMLDKAREKKYEGGVLGVRARPVWSGPSEFTHRGRPVRVVVCPSALAIREVLRERSPDRWLVVITDRDETDLGTGILAHLVFHRLRTPDPWDAVCQAFHAVAVDAALVGSEGSRQVAVGLLDAGMPADWPPAPGGVLTRDHALGAVARRHLMVLGTYPGALVPRGEAGAHPESPDLPGPGRGSEADPSLEIDATSVWTWTARPDAAVRIAELRGLAGDPLTAATLAWLAERTGGAERGLLGLLENGRVADAVPLGLVLGLVTDAARASRQSRQSRQSRPDRDSGTGDEASARTARDALVRLEVPLGGVQPRAPIAAAWSGEARAVTVALLQTPTVRNQAIRILDRADVLLAQVQADRLAASSDLLPSGLTARLHELARVLADAVRFRVSGAPDQTPILDPDPDRPMVTGAALDVVEKAWAIVGAHALADDDERVAAFHAGVRLARWLALTGEPASGSFAALVARHRDHDAWVDVAFTAAARGVGESSLGSALQAVLVATRARRDTHDRVFADALAHHTSEDSPIRLPGVLLIEDVLTNSVLLLTRSVPVLLVVLDGMSMAAAIEVTQDATRTPQRWQEAVPVDTGRRTVAVATLPTTTAGGRTSLFCGELRIGGQDAERDGLADFARAHDVGGAVLFHKRPLEENRLGMAVSDDVAAAVADVEGRRLVACVLNTIDDALDRADPGGRSWAVDTIRHLQPLLRQAWQAGRCVVLTADHGHVIDRRDGVLRPHEHVFNARARAASAAQHGGAAADEVFVAGRRVLVAEKRAVLAVNERLRYVPRKAGYHGGASPAEVLVPVVLLVPGDAPSAAVGGPRLRLAPPQEPSWWKEPDVVPRAAVSAGAAVPGPAAHAPGSPAGRRAAPAVPITDAPDMLPLFDDGHSVSAMSPPTPPPPSVAPPTPARQNRGARTRPAQAEQSKRGPATPVVGEGGRAPAAEPRDGHRVADAVLASPTFRNQEAMTRGRGTLDRAQLRALLAALVSAQGNRLTGRQAAQALSDHPLSARRVALSAARLLNVDGYPVVRLDADGTTVVLDVDLLVEQFGL